MIEDQTNSFSGNYQLTITDVNGCIKQDTFEIIQPIAPLAIDVVNEELVSCYGGADGSLNISASGGTPLYSYLWETGDTDQTIDNLPAKDYLVTITDQHNCILIDTVYLHQNDSISFDLTTLNSTCFAYDDGQIALENISGGVPDYQVISPEIDSTHRTFFDFLSPGNYSVVISDALGCSTSFVTTTTEPSPIWVDIRNPSDSLSVILGTPVDLTTEYNITNPIFIWNPVTGLDCFDCDAPIALPLNSSWYTVEMQDENGCFATDSIWIEVQKERDIAIPNSFTPNFDNHNDIFTLLGNNPAIRQVAVFQVFDRWGGMLFEAKDFQLNDSTYGWDGTANGAKVEAGTYVYYAQVDYVDNEVIEWNGSVLLIR